MKKYFMIFAAALISLAACQEEMAPENKVNEDGIFDYPVQLTFTAGNETATKTVINGTNIMWESTDAIKVLWSATGCNKAIAEPYAENTCAKFSTKVEEADAYFAVHPYAASSTYSEGNIIVTVPAQQGGAFADANIAVAKATEEYAFHFKHLVGIVEFTTDVPGKVTICGAEGDVLTGTVTVTGFDDDGLPVYEVADGSNTIEIDVTEAGTYYAAFLPSANLKCLSIKVGEGDAAGYALSANQLQMARGKVWELGNVSSRLGLNYFVSATADGNGDGKTWETAFTFDQMAKMLSANREGALSDDYSDETYKETHASVHSAEIEGRTFHIAEGTYQTANYIRMKFAENESAVKVALKGGYNPDSKGTDLSNRDVTTYVSTIKGAEGATGGSGTKRAFLINHNVDLTIDGITFSDGTGDATYGGGVFFVDQASSSLTCNNCIFTGNTSPTNSGAVYATAGTFTFADCIFDSNTATDTSNSFGGAIRIKNSSLTCTRCEFSNNTSVNNGGAVHLTTMQKADFVDCDFTNNECTANLAGALCLSGANPLTITGGTFSGNKAAKGGGCIYNNAASVINITGTVFTGNESSTLGGVIYNNTSGKTVNITEATFSGNKANEGEGGAIYSKAGTWTIIDNVFENNTASSLGGAVYVAEQAVFNVDGARFSSNSAGGHGGAFHATGAATFTIEDSTFEENVLNADLAGGAVYSNSTSSGNLITSTRFTENSTAGNGGAIYWSGSGKLGIDKSFFDGNISTKHGAAIKNTAGTLYLNASSFTGNQSAGARTGGVIRAESTSFINNCCFYANEASNSNTSLVLVGGTATVLNSTLYESDGTMACVRIYNSGTVANLYNNVLLNPNTSSNEGTVRVGYWANPGSVTSSGYNYTTEWETLVNSGVSGSITMADSDKIVSYSDVSGDFTKTETTDGRNYYTWTAPEDISMTTVADMTNFLNGVTGGADFATWLGTVNGLSHDIAGNPRPATGAVYPGCYQKQ